jgi:hypothetical protein
MKVVWIIILGVLLALGIGFYILGEPYRLLGGR